MNNYYKINKTLMLTVLVLFLVLFATGLFRKTYIYYVYDYERGEYSKYCYKLGEGHGNIEYFEYFKTLEDCGKPFDNN